MGSPVATARGLYGAQALLQPQLTPAETAAWQPRVQTARALGCGARTLLHGAGGLARPRGSQCKGPVGQLRTCREGAGVLGAPASGGKCGRTADRWHGTARARGEAVQLCDHHCLLVCHACLKQAGATPAPAVAAAAAAPAAMRKFGGARAALHFRNKGGSADAGDEVGAGNGHTHAHNAAASQRIDGVVLVVWWCSGRAG